MGKGRPPKPVAQKLLEGNPGGRPLPKVIVMGGVGVPDKPATLSALAGALWDREVPKMVDAGLLDRIDGLLLGQYFEAAALAAVAVRNMSNDDGVVEPLLLVPNNFTGEMGLKKSPGVAVWKDAVATMRQLAAEFGLTPSARARLGVLSAQGGEAQDVEGDIGVAQRFLDGG